MIKNILLSSGQTITLATGQTYDLKDNEVMVNGNIYRKADLEIAVNGNSATSNINDVNIGIRKRYGRLNLPADLTLYYEWSVDGIQQASLADALENIQTAIYYDPSVGGGGIYDLQNDIAFNKTFSLTENGGVKTTIDLSGFVQFADLYGQNAILEVDYYWINNYQYKLTRVKWVEDGLLNEVFLDQTITLIASDPDDNRIDSVVWNITSDTAYKVDGTADPQPSPPPLAEDELLLFNVDVDKNTTQPTGVTSQTIYDENLQEVGGEYDTSTNAPARVTLNDATTPQSGAVNIRYAVSSQGDYTDLDTATPFIINNYTFLIFRVFVEVGNNNNAIRVAFRTQAPDASVASILLTNGQYGFNAQNTSTWQTIILPIANFGISGGLTSDRVRFENRRNNSTFRIDNIVLQEGLNPPNISYQYEFYNDEINKVLQLKENNNIVSKFDYSSFSTAKYYPIRDYGAKGDGIDGYDGVTLATDKTFNSASMSVTTADIGKIIAIKGAGTGGGYHVTSIESINNPTSLEMVDPAVTTVASNAIYFYGTDDTTAIQDTINAAYAAGGGKVYVPKGIYVINGALQNNVGVDSIDYNSQLWIPAVDGGTTDYFKPTIEIEGEMSPNLRNSGTAPSNTHITDNSGAVLRSTIQGSGTRPCVICNRGASTYSLERSWTNVKVSNIHINLLPNSSNKLTMGGIDCYHSKIANFEYVVIDPWGIVFKDSAKPDTIDVVGIALPKLYCEHQNTIIKCNVACMTSAYTMSDHGSLYDSTAWACTNAVKVIDAQQTCTIHHLIEHSCINTITVANDTGSDSCQIRATMLQSERIATGWYQNVYTINDPSNIAKGTIEFNIVEWGVGHNQLLFTKNGGSNLKCIPISFSPTNSQTVSAYTANILDAHRTSKLSDATGVAVTIPNSSTVQYDVDALLQFEQAGNGQLTFAGASGVTLNTPETLKSRKQYSIVGARYNGNNVWTMVGDLELA